MASLRVALEGDRLVVREGAASRTAVPSMQHPDFRRVLERGWVSPPSFGPRGDLRIYSAAHPGPAIGPYEWLASADWRRGRIQVDRRGAISDIAMEPYGGGRGKAAGEHVEIAVDYQRRELAIAVEGAHRARGRWTDRELTLEADAGAARVVTAPFACALFLWAERPAAFLVEAARPFA